MTQDDLIFTSGLIYGIGVNLLMEGQSKTGFLFIVVGFILFILVSLNGGDTDAFG